MFSMVLALLFCYTLMQAIFTLFSLGKSKNLPPGPTPLSIIGNLYQLGKNPHQSLAELAKIHGPIMFLKLGRINTLVISSAAAAKLVLQKQDLTFSNRFVSDIIHAHNHFQESVVWLPIGAKWRSLRKLLNSNIFSGKRLDNGISKQLMAIDTNVTAHVNVTGAPVTNTIANHAEKPEKFNGKNFKRWQQKMFFYLTTLNLARFLNETAPQVEPPAEG
ncbi:7-ethoxycoumarin O-deethylase-like protein [Tanacetum coccineum]